MKFAEAVSKARVLALGEGKTVYIIARSGEDFYIKRKQNVRQMDWVVAFVERDGELGIPSVTEISIIVPDDEELR
jgi:hypothetical protein